MPAFVVLDSGRLGYAIGSIAHLQVLAPHKSIARNYNLLNYSHPQTFSVRPFISL
ncbi:MULTISPECIES: hypothetical protein [unclassified Microcoleus]|uniref:hypothetical protein n=1 Tax=unclassified Microcoleus TaxID=2642155 RepID=UPI001DE73725|nr:MULTISPECIES: hypothetical protein [unclassified Microcoleus]MCC3475729.1 hypothetical protein [Microcoleus sp. PH2017_13_LAR_U_A]MCC3525701.1 hypothetical protein [Microcoleus sp. PH2017_20_SFW_D_A]